MPSSFQRKQGSAMVESCLVIALLCVVLFMMLQVSYVVSSRNIISYASIAAARAAAVGLDEDMVKTVVHYATIPTAGPMIFPDPKVFRKYRNEGNTVGSQWDYALSSSTEPRSERGEYEVAMRTEFHRRDYPLAVLAYENWSPEGEAEVYSDFTDDDYNEEILEVTVSQKLPLTYPFSRVFWGHLPLVKVSRGGRTEEFPSKQIDATSYIENHARFYLKRNY